MSTINALGVKTRLTGMSSGLDTDALVKNMLLQQQFKLSKMSQNKTLYEWKKTAYTELNNTLRKFKDDFISALGSKTMMSSGAYKSFSVTMESNSSLRVKADAGAKIGNYNVVIDNIASASGVTGGKATNLTNGYSASVLGSVQLRNLSSLSSGGAASLADGAFTINGVEISYKATDTLRTVMERVNNSKAGVTMSYSQLTDTFTVESKATGAYDPSVTHPGEFTLVKPDADALPDSSDPGYEAAKLQYDADLAAYNEAHAEHTQALAAYNTNEQKNVRIEDSSGFMAMLGVSTDPAAVVNGRDASFSINGVSKTSASNNVNFDGIDFTFLAPTASTGITAAVERNVQESVDKIKGFVEDLNKLLSDLYSQLTEKKNRQYAPLTDDMRAGMSEQQIKDWEVEAQKGLMYRDNYLDSLFNEIRGIFSSDIGGRGLLSSIGITTSSYQAGSAPQIIIDEAKLTAALENDPDKVQAMFSEISQRSADGKGGLVTRIGTAIDRFTDNTKNIPLQGLDRNIRDITKRMVDLDDRIYQLSERYYRQFAKMEAALAQMQGQTQQLTNFMDMSTGNKR